jgi:thiamine biosynthesis lipoprotein
MIRRAQPWLGTLVEVSIGAIGGLAPDPQTPADLQAANQAINLAFAQIGQVHRLMSFHDAASDVSRFNRASAGELQPVDPHTWAVLALAQQISASSDGIFNIACAPRLVAWDCLPSPAPTRPAYEPSAAVLSCEADSMVRKLAPGWIDLGGIAKGYAVDLAVEALRAAGVTSACVNAGGDLRVLGDTAWPVAIRDPLAPFRTAKTVHQGEGAMATSGAYFSAKRHKGQQVCALVDGRNGEPLPGSTSITVQAPRCAVADALTKVVVATADTRHPALQAWDATAFII